MISEASQILETIRALGADIVVDLKVRPALRVPDDLIHRAAAHADEIRALLAELAAPAAAVLALWCGSRTAVH